MRRDWLPPRGVMRPRPNFQVTAEPFSPLLPLPLTTHDPFDDFYRDIENLAGFDRKNEDHLQSFFSRIIEVLKLPSSCAYDYRVFSPHIERAKTLISSATNRDEVKVEDDGSITVTSPEDHEDEHPGVKLLSNLTKIEFTVKELITRNIAIKLANEAIQMNNGYLPAPSFLDFFQGICQGVGQNPHLENTYLVANEIIDRAKSYAASDEQIACLENIRFLFKKEKYAKEIAIIEKIQKSDPRFKDYFVASGYDAEYWERTDEDPAIEESENKLIRKYCQGALELAQNLEKTAILAPEEILEKFKIFAGKSEPEAILKYGDILMHCTAELLQKSAPEYWPQNQTLLKIIYLKSKEGMLEKFPEFTFEHKVPIAIPQRKFSAALDELLAQTYAPAPSPAAAGARAEPVATTAEHQISAK